MDSTKTNIPKKRIQISEVGSSPNIAKSVLGINKSCKPEIRTYTICPKIDV